MNSGVFGDASLVWKSIGAMQVLVALKLYFIFYKHVC